MNSLIGSNRDTAEGKGADSLILNWRFMIELVVELYVLWIGSIQVLVTVPGVTHKTLNLRFKLHGCVGRILGCGLKFIKGLHLGHLITLL